MEKYIYDKNNGLWYELQGDYYIPSLIFSASSIFLLMIKMLFFKCLPPV